MRGSGLQFNINTEEILNLFGKTFFLFRSPFSSLLWTEKDKVSIKQIHMALKTINYDWKCLSQVEHLLWSIIVVVYLVLYQIWVPTTIIFYEGLSDTRFRLDSPSSHPVLNYGFEEDYLFSVYFCSVIHSSIKTFKTRGHR